MRQCRRKVQLGTQAKRNGGVQEKRNGGMQEKSRKGNEGEKKGRKKV